VLDLDAQWKFGPIGFAYDDWAGSFYPPGLRRERRLEHLATRYEAVELDTTFYALPPSHVVASWASQAPSPFLFVVKAPAEVTHRPASAKAALEKWKEFLGCLEALGPDRTYPFLQFPPGFDHSGRGRLEGLLETAQPWMDRIVLEMRHQVWSERGGIPLGPSVALCDRAGLGEAGAAPRDGEFIPWPPVDQASFLYLRLNGRHGQYESDSVEVCDPTDRLRWWLAHIKPLLQPSRRVIVVAGNSYAGCAPATLDRFTRLVGLTPKPPLQAGLFD
jgi:uncharacterized protein YecE (DUF72 family)